MKKFTMENNIFYIGVGIIGVFLSILWLILVNTQPFSDFQYYNVLATQISKGGMWGNTYTSVGYPIFLGLLYKVFGTNIFIGKIFNLILYGLSLLFIKMILDKVNISSQKSKLIFLIFAFFPTNIFYVSILAAEPLFTCLMLLCIYLYFSDLKYKYVILGIVTGLNTMVKPFFILLSFAIFLTEIIVKRKLISSLKNALITLILCLITISPFIYRNTKLNGEFTWVSNNGGIVLYINNNSQNTTGSWMPVADVKNSIALTEEYKTASMTKKNKMLSNAAKQWIITHPTQFINLGIKRIRNSYFRGDDLGYSLVGTKYYSNSYNLSLKYNTIKSIVSIPASIYILLYSLFILYVMIKRRWEKINKFNLFILILFYMFTCTYFITEGQGRYFFPTMILFDVMFVNLITGIYKKIKIIRR